MILIVVLISVKTLWYSIKNKLINQCFHFLSIAKLLNFEYLFLSYMMSINPRDLSFATAMKIGCINLLPAVNIIIITSPLNLLETKAERISIDLSSFQN